MGSPSCPILSGGYIRSNSDSAEIMKTHIEWSLKQLITRWRATWRLMVDFVSTKRPEISSRIMINKGLCLNWL